MPETAPHPSEASITSKTHPETVNHIEAQPRLDFEAVKQVVSGHVERLQKQVQVKHRRIFNWAKRQGYQLPAMAEPASKAMLSAGLIGSLLINTPQTMINHQAPGLTEAGQTSSISTGPQEHLAGYMEPLVQTTRQKQQLTVVAVQQNQAQFQAELSQQLLSQSQAGAGQVDSQKLATMVSQLTGVQAVDELEGYRLNTNLGRIGAEQHLRLYPGQTIEQHFATPQLRLAHQSSGFAPGNGAYGVFAPSAAAVTPEIVEREKYYVAIQTFLSPNWQGNVNQAYNWFRYRKVIVYHPVTQKAVVAVVGDAGPALSTGKNYGGSPEVMAGLSAYDGYGTPPVMMFFVDDPDNKIPLGPVNFKVTPLEQ